MAPPSRKVLLITSFAAICIQIYFFNQAIQPFSQINESSPRREISHLGDGCYHVLLDVGSNIGMHGRFLFEPDKFPLSKLSVPTLNKEFGTERDNRDFCVFAFGELIQSVPCFRLSRAVVYL